MVFKRISHHDTQRACLDISSHHLWRFFDYDELTVNMHLKDNMENYTNMLGRIKLGSPLDSDIQVLNELRIEPNSKASLEQVAYKMCELTQTTDFSIVCIMPLNESVLELNNVMLDKLGISTVEIAAVDSSIRQIKGQKKKTKSKKLTSKVKKII
ncbi:Hypothetical predicted protein [Octopus vulgaris]|uniref:Uncharacterized protein n=1 Tax=Octopus vulgaris TaxID=6645 RepID=A0AA36B6S1_OCTVU|nr:Hypothetical predicted protein [Octopus vulgaris]